MTRPLGSILTIVVAAIILGLYVLLVWQMFDLAEAAPTEALIWERTAKVFTAIQTGAVQTIVIAAAGVLLGTVAQHARVAGANAVAQANVDDATKARAARVILAGPPPPGGPAGQIEHVRQVLA